MSYCVVRVLVEKIEGKITYIFCQHYIKAKAFNRDEIYDQTTYLDKRNKKKYTKSHQMSSAYVFGRTA